MIRKLVVTSLLTLGSTLVLLNPVNAQSSNPEVNQILQETNQLVNEANSFVNNVAIPEGQRYQRYLNQLAQACSRGHGGACQEWRLRNYQQQRWQNHLIQQQRIRNLRRGY
ncbi:hypothetical protein CAL7716_106450 (plasmid) [Calothrix sp. PCC 7716]|nr:hypothetical protein CAL7716_106450 [Calothrix sp. PCC 7716]